MEDPRLCRIVTSHKADKKYDAVFRDKSCPCGPREVPQCGRKEKIVPFGAAGYTDFVTSKDEDRKALYIQRHEKNENWNDPLSPGALSRYILWNKTTLKASIADFRKRFGV